MAALWPKWTGKIDVKIATGSIIWRSAAYAEISKVVYSTSLIRTKWLFVFLLICKCSLLLHCTNSVANMLIKLFAKLNLILWTYWFEMLIWQSPVPSVMVFPVLNTSDHAVLLTYKDFSEHFVDMKHPEDYIPVENPIVPECTVDSNDQNLRLIMRMTWKIDRGFLAMSFILDTGSMSTTRMLKQFVNFFRWNSTLKINSPRKKLRT